MTEEKGEYIFTDKHQVDCDHEDTITMCVYCGTSLPRIDDETIEKAKGLYTKAQKVRVAFEVMVAEREMLRKVLGDAFSALKVWDPLPDELGYGEDGDRHWSLVFELFHNIETALGIDEEE